MTFDKEKIIDSSVLLILAVGILSFSIISSSAAAPSIDSRIQIPEPTVVALPSNNLIITTANYDILLTTAKAGIISKIEVTFPEKFVVSNATMLETIGIGAGSLSKNGTTLIYNLRSAVNVPAASTIRLEIGGITNGVSQINKVGVTTRDSSNKIIDGPTFSKTFTLTAVRFGMIYGGSITGVKIAESFMKFGRLSDGSQGWNPDGKAKSFTITDKAINTSSIVIATVDYGSDGVLGTSICGVNLAGPGKFNISCTGQAPANGTSLNYLVIRNK